MSILSKLREGFEVIGLAAQSHSDLGFMMGARLVDIRPARSDDAERVGIFVRNLSLHTQTLRFFTGLANPSPSMLQTMVTVNDSRDALLALHDGEVVGHAMSFFGPAGNVEIAVVVADEWQGKGLGLRIVQTLARRAAAIGATTVGMDVMGENRKVITMVRKMWPDARMTVSAGTVEITASLQAS